MRPWSTLHLDLRQFDRTPQRRNWCPRQRISQHGQWLAAALTTGNRRRPAFGGSPVGPARRHGVLQTKRRV